MQFIARWLTNSSLPYSNLIMYICDINKKQKVMKNWVIKTFRLKGSWSWAKKQMLKGKIVRCKHWSGALRLKIDSPENTLLQSSFWGGELKSQDRKDSIHKEWETSNHHLNYEDFTDYITV